MEWVYLSLIKDFIVYLAYTLTMDAAPPINKFTYTKIYPKGIMTNSSSGSGSGLSHFL